MATGEPGGSGSSSSQPPMEEMIDRLMEELEEIRKEAGDEETCKKNPNLSSNVPLSSLKTFKLMLEGELEALQEMPLEQLPPDPEMLQELAVEEVQRTAHCNARTLEFYKKKLEELKEKKRKYETKVKRATMVSQTLDKLQSHYLSDEEKAVVLERKHNRTSTLFRFLRGQMHFILETLYPKEMSTPESIKHMEELLDCFVSQMLNAPNDPYVELNETMEEEHINLLLRANLITRHPTDITRVRFIDPRV
ncbi:centromere protein K-like [Scylla paramamosain]|uniref:centromere protein K-like n=1 Tax=Scylla paramamosain TaxID=85552 RepID=UPI0030830EE2